MRDVFLFFSNGANYRSFLEMFDLYVNSVYRILVNDSDRNTPLLKGFIVSCVADIAIFHGKSRREGSHFVERLIWMHVFVRRQCCFQDCEPFTFFVNAYRLAISDLIHRLEIIRHSIFIYWHFFVTYFSFARIVRNWRKILGVNANAFNFDKN